jgi:hypothetical protein
MRPTTARCSRRGASPPTHNRFRRGSAQDGPHLATIAKRFSALALLAHSLVRWNVRSWRRDMSTAEPRGSRCVAMCPAGSGCFHCGSSRVIATVAHHGQCPQPAEAAIAALGRPSGFDPIGDIAAEMRTHAGWDQHNRSLLRKSTVISRPNSKP